MLTAYPQSFSPNFQAYKLNSIKKGLQKIDIYSINTEDKILIDRMLNVAKGQKFPADSKMLGEGTVRNVFDNALKRAKNITPDSNNRVLLAVEDNKKITGIMDIQEAGDMYVKGLAVWNENPAAREGLVISALKDVFKSTGDFACLILPSEKSSNNVKRFFRKLGFKTPRDFGNKNLMVEGENLQSTINKIQDRYGENLIGNKKIKVDLAKTLKLDE